jgi:hypothetical protein
LLQAREALKLRKFARAVEVLEQCKPSILTPEIKELREYAWHEEQLHIASLACADAQTMMRDGRPQDVVDLLTPIAREIDDPRLRAMLDQAQNAIAQLRGEQAVALSRVKPFADTELYEQVVALIQSMPETISSSAEIQELQRASQTAWSQEWKGLEALGRAYAAVESGDLEAIRLGANEVDGSTSLHQMRNALSDRGTTAVDQILTSQVRHIQETKASRTQIDPAAELATNRKLLPFASDAVKAEWAALASQYEKTDKVPRAFGRMGKWIPKMR